MAKFFESKNTYFEVVDLIGEGLNSCVYKAIRKDNSGLMSQDVALKILKSKTDVEVWRRELQSLTRVDSPYCVKVLGFDWLEQNPALVLEWLDGLTLHQLHQNTLIDNRLLREITLQVQMGLIDLHNAGLCHGDLNPHNVLISRRGQVKLLDFGFANVDRVHTQGTPALMAPEIKEGQPPDFWSDLFSLGVLFQSLGLNETEKLTAPRPTRDLIRGQSDPRAMEDLGNLVEQVQNKLKMQGQYKTQVLTSAKKAFSMWFLPPAFLTLFCMLSLTHADGKRRSPLACGLKLQTSSWVEVRVNEARGYAPFSYSNPSCSPLILKWRSQKQSGQLKIQFQPGEQLLLNDRNFNLER